MFLPESLEESGAVPLVSAEGGWCDHLVAEPAGGRLSLLPLGSGLQLKDLRPLHHCFLRPLRVGRLTGKVLKGVSAGLV